MMLAVDDELRAICRDLLAEGWSEAEWAEREADDWVQTERYDSGFSETEGAFTFSCYTGDDEVWFQFTLAEAAAIAAGDVKELRNRSS
ncbi:MAG: hypothetical protein ACREOG_21725 [Gemmatimonadaceae bacterium]